MTLVVTTTSNTTVDPGDFGEPMLASEVMARLTQALRLSEQTIERAARRMNSFTHTLPQIEEDTLERDVSLTAAFLDEHVPGWASRIKNKLVMSSPYHCVLGQIFDEDKGYYRDGYIFGLTFLKERLWVEKPFVFAASEAAPFWEAEIAKRGVR